MKQYIPGLIAIVCALAISAFNKPFTTFTFRLSIDPILPSRVHNNANWSTGGAYWGVCVFPVNEIACEINLNTSHTSFFHNVGGSKILNTLVYASSLIPKQDYLEILEGPGFMADRTITSIIPMHWDSSSGTYVSVSLGPDLSYKNGDD
jgi:hypothetical protein